MGNKRNNNVKQLRPQNAFQDQVAQAVNQKMADYVSKQVNYLGSILAQEQKSNLEDIYSRLVALETLVLKNFNVSEDQFALMVADVQDNHAGLVSVDSVEKGDLVRLEISTKTKNQVDYSGISRQRIPQVGSGQTFGPQIEDAIVGMKLHEVKEIEFGQDNQLVAKLNVQRISRSKEVKDETNNA